MCFGDLEGKRIAAVRDSGEMAATQDKWAAGDYDVRWPGACFPRKLALSALPAAYRLAGARSSWLAGAED